METSHPRERSKCIVHFDTPKFQNEALDHLDLKLFSVELKLKGLCLAAPSRCLHLVTPLDQAQEAMLLH